MSTLNDVRTQVVKLVCLFSPKLPDDKRQLIAESLYKVIQKNCKGISFDDLIAAMTQIRQSETTLPEGNHIIAEAKKIASRRKFECLRADRDPNISRMEKEFDVIAKKHYGCVSEKYTDLKQISMKIVAYMHRDKLCTQQGCNRVGTISVASYWVCGGHKG